ncbi:MAG: hypothetical protein WCR27_01010 [Eubacteriales bacterium]
MGKLPKKPEKMDSYLWERLSLSAKIKCNFVIKLYTELAKYQKGVYILTGFGLLFSLILVLKFNKITALLLAGEFLSIYGFLLLITIFCWVCVYITFGELKRLKEKLKKNKEELTTIINNSFCNCNRECDCKDSFIEYMLIEEDIELV